MRKFFLFTFFILLLHLGQIVYFQRSYFSNNYEIQYWKDRYEHSQYQLPLSKRIIGDDGLYAYAGYRLIQGDNPFSINDNKPPAGLYFIGLSILLFKSPAYFGLFFGIGSLIISYFIVKKIFNKSSLALFSITLLFLDPLFFSQFWKPWLDIPQLFFLLLNVFFLLYLSSAKKRFLFVFLSGLSLGLFSEIKPPILLPIIFLLESVFLLTKIGKKEFLVFLVSIIVGAFLPYFHYLQLGHSLFDVARVHKYMASIYLASKTGVHFEAIWKTLLLGLFPDISSSSIMKVSEWWFLWPIATIVSVIFSFFTIFKKKFVILKGFSLFFLFTLLVYTFIPSYPRYLILVLPILYLFFALALVNLLKNSLLRNFIFIIILCYGILNAFFFLKPNPSLVLNNFYYNLSNQYFQDIYEEDIAKENFPNINRNEFRLLAGKAFKDASVKTVKAETIENNIPKFGDKGSVRVKMTYKTQDLGQFSEEKQVDLIKEGGQWKIIWNWNFILNNFLPSYMIERKTIVGKRGSILTLEGKILAEDKIGSLISINPGKIDTKKEQQMLKILEKYNFGRGGVELQNAYLENPISGEYIPILTPNVILTTEEKKEILSYPGIVLNDYPTRVYNGLDPRTIKNTEFKDCCSRIYSSYNYHGIEGIEKKYDEVLAGYSGGKISIKDKAGKTIRIVLEKNPKDGKDVIL